MTVLIINDRSKEAPVPWWHRSQNQIAFMNREMHWRTLRIQTANMGRPMGLSRNAMVRRIIPFFGEYVIRTAVPRSAMIPLTIRRGIAEKEMIPMQTSVNRSISRITGAVSILRIHFMGSTSFATSLYGWWGYNARIRRLAYSFDRAARMLCAASHSRSWLCCNSSKSAS